MECYYKNVHSIRINNYKFWDAARIISKSCFFSETKIQTHRRFRLRRIFVGYVFFFFFDKPLSTLQLFRMNVSSLTSANKKKRSRIFLNFAKKTKNYLMASLTDKWCRVFRLTPPPTGGGWQRTISFQYLTPSPLTSILYESSRGAAVTGRNLYTCGSKMKKTHAHTLRHRQARVCSKDLSNFVTIICKFTIITINRYGCTCV